MRNGSDKGLEKIETNTFYAIFFSFENDVVQEIMWKNSVEPVRPQITI